jgi:hypothetical protein
MRTKINRPDPEDAHLESPHGNEGCQSSHDPFEFADVPHAGAGRGLWQHGWCSWHRQQFGSSGIVAKRQRDKWLGEHGTHRLHGWRRKWPSQ